MGDGLPVCARCGATIAPPELPHRFESTAGLLLEVLCDACCYRCWAGRREEAP